MYLSDEEIIRIILDYFQDDKRTQAIMIDGEWGSGKTHFIQKKLKPALESALNDEKDNKRRVIFIDALVEALKYVTGGMKKKRRVYYISLNGLDDYSQVMDELYSVFMETMMREKMGESWAKIATRGGNMSMKLLTTGAKFFNIDMKDLPRMEEFMKLGEGVFIFDDLERCSIDIHRLLGGINDLVEHNGIKVVLVANESEINTTNVQSDLILKHFLMLSEKLKLERPESLGPGPNPMSNSTGKGSQSVQISFEELQAYTEAYFPVDQFYKKSKEKLIGFTIRYRANVEMVFNDILAEYASEETSRILYTQERKAEIIDTCERSQHSNIRTLIFIVQGCNRLFKPIFEVDCEDDSIKQHEYTQILKYIVEVAIRVKMGYPLANWKRTDLKTDQVMLLRLSTLDATKGPNLKNKWMEILGYAFVDNFLSSFYCSEVEIKEVISERYNRMNEIKSSQSQNIYTFKELRNWVFMEDDEIRFAIQKTYEELKESKYHPNIFRDMIITLISLEQEELSQYDYEKWKGLYIEEMTRILEAFEGNLNLDQLSLVTDRTEYSEKFNEAVAPLLKIVNEKILQKKEERTEIYSLRNSWGEAFEDSCLKNREVFIDEKGFLHYYDGHIFIENLKKSSVHDIYAVINGIRLVYSFTNLSDYFKSDLETIEMLMKRIESEDLANGKLTRQKALDALVDELRYVVKRIEP